MAETYPYPPPSRTHDLSPNLRPLEPRRSRNSSSTGPGQARQSTITWISSSQFNRNPAPAQVPRGEPSSMVQSPVSPESYGPPIYPQDEYAERPHPAELERAPTDAEHMTLDLGPDGDFTDGVEGGGDAHRKRGTFVGGFMRKIMRRSGRPESDYDSEGMPATHEGRNVTYVDTTEMPEDPPLRRPMISTYTGVSGGLASVREHESPEQADYELGPEHAVSQAGSHVGSHQGTAVHSDHEAREYDGTTAAHHGPPFHIHPGQIGTPVSNEPPPGSDFDKMSAFHTAPSELYSLSSYVDRIALFFRDLYDLPWISPQIAADYSPGENNRSKYYRFKMRHPSNKGSVEHNSWYTHASNQNVDLLEGDDGNYRMTPAPQGSFGVPGPAYSAEAYASPYPTNIQPQYYGAYGDDNVYADERVASPLARSHPSQRSQRSYRTAPEGGGAPPITLNGAPMVPPGWAPHVAPPSELPSIASERSDRMPRSILQNPRSPPPGAASSMHPGSPRTDATIVTTSHTQASTVRGPGRDRGTPAATAGSEIGGRSRQSWYSSTGGENSPTTPKQQLYGGTPGSPSRRATLRESFYRRRSGASFRSPGGSAVGSPGRARSPEMMQAGTGANPVFMVPMRNVPSSPQPLATNLGSPRRNRYDRYEGAPVYGSPPSAPLPFAMNRG